MSLPSMDDEAKLHVVMFPWLAMGHLIPFLELSKCLAQKGHRISFVSTPRNIERLPKIPRHLSPLINLVKFRLPHEENLLENAESTIDLPTNKVNYLKKAFDGLEVPFANFLENSVPDWIIYDFAAHWLPALANNLDVPCAYFCLINASSASFVGSPSSLMGLHEDSWKSREDLTVVPKWIPFSSNVFLHLHEVLRVVNNLGENVSGVSDGHRMALAIQGCDVVFIRSCLEFEPDWLRLLEEEIYKKRVIHVGLLPPTAQESEDDKVDEKWEEMKQWLDKQRPASVVYVALGSEVYLSQEELTELALGLELSELPFFWVLRRPPAGSVVLPTGFEDRIGVRGIICKGWAPQFRILAHPSIGCFLTHCGWNSIVEALGFGRALIMLPFMAEQGLNARVLQERKIGLEIPRNEQDGSFTRDSVAKSLRMVIVDEEGKPLRTNARELREIFNDKHLHDRYINKFIEYLQDHVRKRSHE